MFTVCGMKGYFKAHKRLAQNKTANDDEPCEENDLTAALPTVVPEKRQRNAVEIAFVSQGHFICLNLFAYVYGRGSGSCYVFALWFMLCV